MSEPQPLYRKPALLNRKAHASLRFKPVSDYAFARQQSTYPVVITEFVEAAAHYPLLFINGEGSAPTPVVATSLELTRNDFVNEQGQWRRGTYVPAYVRRYPFTFADLPTEGTSSQNLALCVDLDAPHLAEQGVAIFEASGDEPCVVDQALEFCNRYQRSYLQTQRMCEHLQGLDLFSERQFRVSYQNEERPNKVLKGCSVIDEKKLRALDDNAFLELRQRQYLPAIYAHLSSLQRLATLATLTH